MTSQKTKQQSCLILPEVIRKLLFVFIAILMMANFSCKKFIFKNEIIQCDSLLTYISDVKKVLIIDDIYLQSRIDSMKIISEFISGLDSTRFNDELKFDFVTYKGILKSYKDYLQTYHANVYDNKFLESSVKELRKLYLEKNQDKINNDSTLLQLKKLVNEHRKNTKDNIRSIINLENIYTRVSPRIHQFYYKMKK